MEGDIVRNAGAVKRRISIHSLRMEGDAKRLCSCSNSTAFQSTPSAWRETRICGAAEWNQRHFNPLPPHGGRHIAEVQKTLPSAISIHSLRMEGDRVHHLRIQRAKNFNPLPPHGGRLQTVKRLKAWYIFQSTPSAWRETLNLIYLSYLVEFQSTPSAWRETFWCWHNAQDSDISIHSLRMEGDISYD